MTVKDIKKFTKLSSCLNKTFGVASSGMSSTESIIMRLVDDEMMHATFLIVVNFSSEGMWRELRKRFIDEGLQKINNAMKKAAEEYKTLTGETVSLKILPHTVNDSMELVNYSMYNPKKTAYFRVMCNASVS